MDILYNTVYKANGVNNSLIAVSYIQYVDFLIKSEKRKKKYIILKLFRNPGFSSAVPENFNKLHNCVL